MHNNLTSRYVEPLQRPLGVLIADDDTMVRDIVEAALRPEGYTLWLAASGEQALESFRTDYSLIDAALLDVNMPRGDGPRTLTAMREISPEIPSCFMSGGLGDYTADDLRRRGGRMFLSKPFTPQAVVAAVRGLIFSSSTVPDDVRRHAETPIQSEQMDLWMSSNSETAGRSGTGNTRDARGP